MLDHLLHLRWPAPKARFSSGSRGKRRRWQPPANRAAMAVAADTHGQACLHRGRGTSEPMQTGELPRGYSRRWGSPHTGRRQRVEVGAGDGDGLQFHFNWVLWAIIRLLVSYNFNILSFGRYKGLPHNRQCLAWSCADLWLIAYVTCNSVRVAQICYEQTQHPLIDRSVLVCCPQGGFHHPSDPWMDPLLHKWFEDVPHFFLGAGKFAAHLTKMRRHCSIQPTQEILVTRS